MSRARKPVRAMRLAVARHRSLHAALRAAPGGEAAGGHDGGVPLPPAPLLSAISALNPGDLCFLRALEFHPPNTLQS